MGVTIDLQGTINSRSATAAVSAMRRAGAVMKRALVMDPGALVRLSAVGERSTDLFISTPLGCVASVRVPGQVGGAGGVSNAGTVTYASDALEAIVAFEPGQQTLDLGADMDLMWVGTPPPQKGFELIDTVPGDVVRGLHADMATENEANSGPMGIARSLLEQQVLSVQRGNDASASVALEGRTIAALGGLRLVPEPGQKLRDYDYVRVSASGSWIRVDALVGSVYAPRPGGLARVPGPR